MELDQAKIENIFVEIDTDKDGLISAQDLENTEYALSIFAYSTEALGSFSSLPQGKMNLKDFTMLCYAAKYKLYDLAIMKFRAELYLNKYLMVSAPGEAAPSVKQSYIRLKAKSPQENEKNNASIGVEFGVDKPHQQEKIKEITSAMGHPPHQVFVLLKLKVNKNGEQLAQKIGDVVNTIIQFAAGVAVGFEELIGGLKAYTKYYEGYIYLVIEVDNPLIDLLISFLTQVLQSVSPQCAFKFKGSLTSAMSNMFEVDFHYFKSGGQINLEFDIDHVTLKKIKEIIGDQIEGDIETPLSQLIPLLLEEIKVEAEFESLGEAITSALKIQPEELPKPAHALSGIKEMNIKENVESLGGQAQGLLENIKNSCQTKGELSINLHDFFLKITFNVNIKNAFDLIC